MITALITWRKEWKHHISNHGDAIQYLNSWYICNDYDITRIRSVNLHADNNVVSVRTDRSSSDSWRVPTEWSEIITRENPDLCGSLVSHCNPGTPVNVGVKLPYYTPLLLAWVCGYTNPIHTYLFLRLPHRNIMFIVRIGDLHGVSQILRFVF